MVFILITQLAQAQSLIDLAPPPDAVASECEYLWAVSPHTVVPAALPSIADSMLIEWLGADNPISGSVLDSMVTCVYSNSDDSKALSLLILSFKKDEQALVLYEYLTNSRWLANRVELIGSIVLLARQGVDTREVCVRLLCNETSDRIFEYESTRDHDRSKGAEIEEIVRNVLKRFWGRASRRDGSKILPEDDLEAGALLISRHDALRTLAVGNLSGNARRCGLEWEDTFLAFMRAERSRFWDEKQIAFFGILHGIGQSMTFSMPGECGEDERVDVSSSFREYLKGLKSTRGRRVWPR